MAHSSCIAINDLALPEYKMSLEVWTPEIDKADLEELKRHLELTYKRLDAKQ